MRAKIISLGTALPERFITQREAYDALGYTNPRTWRIFENAGISRRPVWISPERMPHLTPEELAREYLEGALFLGLEAATICLEGIDISCVGSLTLATTTQPHLLCPSLSYRLSALLHLPSDIEHTDMIGGGCFPEGVDLVSGEYLPLDISKLTPGISVIAHDGELHQVKQVFRRYYEGPLIKIKPYCLPPMTPTPEHPFWIVRSRFCRRKERIRPTTKGYKMDATPVWESAEKLTKADFLLLPIPRYTEITDLKISQYLNVIVENGQVCTLQRTKKPGNQRRTTAKLLPDDVLNESFIRLCGIYVAEGNLDGDRHLQFTFGSHEPELITECISLLKTLGLKVKPSPNTGKSIRVRVYSATLNQLFRKWFGEHAHTKRLPRWVFQLSTPLKEVFLKGHFDGDGYGGPGYKRYTTSSKCLAQQLFMLLVMTGKFPSWSIKTDNTSKLCPQAYPSHRISVYPGGKHYCYSDGQYVWFPIERIERQDFKGFVYNAEIEGVNSFVCNLVAVHNCQGGLPAICRAAENFLRTGRPGLVISTEICTATYFPAPERDLENVVANAIFSDGAAACLVGWDDDPRHPMITGFASEFDPQYMSYLGYRWQDGRLKVILHKDVPKVAPILAERVLQRLFMDQDLPAHLKEIDHFVIHPGGVKVLDNIRDRLGIPEEKLGPSRQILREQGNQSSATIGSIGRLVQKVAQPGEFCLVLSMGAGFKTYAIEVAWI